MDIIKAVELAKNGDNTGIAYLYEETYQKGYYIALKYLKNEHTAQDVLQDSYIKAFQNINQLEDASKFEGWFGRIVATRSLNELKKNNPMLFSETENEDEGDISDTFEDDRIDTCPELAIDQQETSRLIQEMMAELSDEQRMCITMFYMEEMSVKEISETLGVSESTVKSRLNYGRTKIKDKVLELEKKGTKLYGLLPMVFFFALFKKDALACEVAVPAASSMLSGVGVAKGTATATASTTSSASAATSTTAGAVKAGLTIGGITLSGKALIAVIVAAVLAIGGVAYNTLLGPKIFGVQKIAYIDFNGIGTYTVFKWGECYARNPETNEMYKENISLYLPKPTSDNMYDYTVEIKKYGLEETPHIYAKSYDGIIYFTSDRNVTTEGNNPNFIYGINPNNEVVNSESCDRYDDFDENMWATFDYGDDKPYAQIYYGLLQNNFDFSDWIDITTFVKTSKSSSEKDFKYSKRHNDKWVEMIRATDEPLPELPKAKEGVKEKEVISTTEQYVEDKVQEEAQEELIQEETKPENNGLAGRYEMAPGIDAWMILKINDDGTGTYEYGDGNGKLQPTSATTFNMVSNFDGSTHYKLSLSDNGDGTYNAVTTYIGGPNQFSDDWTLVKK